MMMIFGALGSAEGIFAPGRIVKKITCKKMLTNE